MRHSRRMWDVWTRADLRALGLTGRAITAAVRAGRLIHARRDNYLAADAPRALVEAVRVGGRLGCLSLLALWGVFVFERPALHVHMERGDSRMRAPDHHGPLPPRGRRDGLVLHWNRFVAEPARGCVDVVDALVQAVCCQLPRHAVATLDSALNKRLVSEVQLAEIFGALPSRYGVLRPLLDARAQSGTETLVRLMLRRIGCSFDLQVHFAGVGDVDLVVDGWLVIECDSNAFHSSWRQQLKDRRRDLALARQGYCVLRLAAEDILYREDQVFHALVALITRGPAPR